MIHHLNPSQSRERKNNQIITSLNKQLDTLGRNNDVEDKKLAQQLESTAIIKIKHLLAASTGVSCPQ